MDVLRLLDRAPRRVRDAVLDVTRGHGFLGAVYDRIVHRSSSAEMPALPASREARVRLLIGPANEVEQGYHWARAVERGRPDVEAVAAMGFDPGGYGVRADLRIPTPVYLRASAWHAAFEAYLRDRTHVLVESALPLLGRRHPDAFAEIAALRDAGVRVAVLFHGSDVRPPREHARESEWSPFRDPQVTSNLIADRAERALRGVRSLGVPIFVSTPDLLRFVPEAAWLPVVVDASSWSSSRPALDGRTRPVVVHAPSSARIKGTHRIEPIVRRLVEEGVVEYRRVSGVPASEMPAVYAGADVVLDQFLIGSYGVAACEALASGRLVVGHVDDATRAAVHRLTGRDLPIVEATVDSLDGVLRAIAADPAAFEHVRAAGPDYVAEVHDGRRSARALADFLGLSV